MQNRNSIFADHIPPPLLPIRVAVHYVHPSSGGHTNELTKLKREVVSFLASGARADVPLWRDERSEPQRGWAAEGEEFLLMDFNRIGSFCKNFKNEN